MSEDKRVNDRRIADRRFGWLVSDWKAAHKWLSVQFATVLAGLQIAYELLPAAQSYLPPSVARWTMVAGLVAVILARIKAQPKTEPPK